MQLFNLSGYVKHANNKHSGFGPKYEQIYEISNTLTTECIRFQIIKREFACRFQTILSLLLVILGISDDFVALDYRLGDFSTR